MKIKELHLRNIASIEEADIDFEKDLVDGVTGTPASVFLIAGDTGTGKSIILDGISMALYKTTPRLKGVANQQSNEFKNAGGETIRVASLEQYTRLGIAPKDPCYSQVVFEGNDGKEYRATLTLGLMNGRADAEGNKPVKHCTPSWKLTVGTDEYSKDGDIRDMIDKAVGLDFNQFSRMAMLAQGQFAAFLTGDKKKREEILEQLTNTEIFSNYGKAILKLFGQADKKREIAQTAYDTESVHKLPEDQVESLIKEKEETEQLKAANDRLIAANQTKLTEVEKIEESDKTIQEFRIKRTLLEETLQGEPYRLAKALVGDWDSTVEERSRLAILRQAKENLVSEEKNAQMLAGQFATLASDLVFRQNSAQAEALKVKELQDWLKAREDRKSLFGMAGETGQLLNQYQETSGKIKKTENKIKEESGKRPALEADVKEKAEDEEKAGKAVIAIQGQIDTLTEERTALNPQQVNDDLEATRSRISSLGKLEGDIKTLEKKESDKNALSQEIETAETTLTGLEEAAKDAQVAYAEAKAADDTAQRCLTTMSGSKEDLLVELRQSLIRDGGEICPLCGQKIVSITNDFEGQLTKLEIIRQEKKDALEKAEEARDLTVRKKDTFAGELKGKRKALKESIAEIGGIRTKLTEDASLLGIDLSGQFQDQIDAAKEIAEKRYESLKKDLKKAEELQKRINELLEEKKPLDVALKKAGEKAGEAKKALEDNEKSVLNLKGILQEKTEESGRLTANLSGRLEAFYPGWKEDPEKTRRDLATEAKEYNDQSSACIRKENGLEAARQTISTLQGFKSQILGTWPSWNSVTAPACHPSRAIENEWTGLSSAASSLHTKMEGLRKTVSECARFLDNWYSQTGRDEKALDSIAGAASRLDEARRLIKETNQDLKSANDAIEHAIARKKASMDTLDIESEADIPAKVDLEKEKDDLKITNDDLVQKITTISNQLDGNKAVLKSIEDKKAALDEAEKGFRKWKTMNDYFGGTRFRTLVQTYILRPLLNNANIYLKQITDRYTLTCSEENEQLSILVKDNYNKGQVRSATVLSGGESFMISLALSLALSSLNRPDMNVNILFIDEGFGTLDEKSLDSVMQTLERLQEIAGESSRRVGIISHREELDERVPVQLRVVKKGEGRSKVEFKNSLK